jgi:phosphoribosylformylglycinamidine synthase
VPLRDPTLSPEEILMSESQERMMAIVAPEDVDRFMEICRKWDVQATVLGELTNDNLLTITWHGETIVQVDPHTVTAGPVVDRPRKRPAWLAKVNEASANDLPRTSDSRVLSQQFLAVIGSPNQADKSWVTDQYDRFVRGNSVLSQPEDAGMLRIDETTNLGIALACDANGRYTYLNPFIGAQLALCEAYRNVSATGAEPVAITDCLNFGSPEDPEVMWQFLEAIKGLVEGCKILGTPVTGGNVSFYNQTGTTNIIPTPVVGMLGVLDDVTKRVPSGFQNPGDVILLLGDTFEEFGGSVWADVCHDHHLGGMPPFARFEAEKALSKVLVEGSKHELLSSAHDLSEGGLAQALAESCLRRNLGATVSLPGKLDPTSELFSESVARALVSLPTSSVGPVLDLCAKYGVAFARLGEVTEIRELSLNGLFNLPLTQIRTTWSATIPDAMNALPE